jgi:ATP-binding cassette subfamily B protein
MIILQLVAGYFVFHGSLTAGIFITLTAWFTQGLGQIQALSWIQRKTIVAYVDVIKFKKFMDVIPDVRNKPNAIDIHGKVGDISFNEVKFAYPKRAKKDNKQDPMSLNILTSVYEAEKNDEESGLGKDILKGLSITFEKGKKYAVVGHSGAGKSTIIHLLLRAYDPQGGSISFDGKDIRDVSIRSLRHAIGVVPQEIAIFDGTLKDNILFGVGEGANSISDEDIMKVIEHSRINEFFPNLEKGLDTLLGEKGLKLSGGQRQRVGIARAIIKNPEVLVFDEATSHLDMNNEEMIRRSILEVSAGKTLITIAHRLATVRDMDEIIVLKDGVVVGKGTHSELAENNAEYKDLIKSQVF